MSELVVVAAFAYFGDHDFTGDIHTWAMAGSAEPKRKTNFRSGGSNEYRIGLKSTTLSMEGNADLSPTGPDAALFTPYAGRASRVVTMGNDETEGQPCVMSQGLVTSFTPGGGAAVGELGMFTMRGAGTDEAGGVRGRLLKKVGNVSATGAIGTGVQAGAVGASQYLYSTLHLFGTAGTTITVVLESDDNSGFTSATTRGTFGPLTAVGGNWLTRVAGPITDDWWRLRVTAITGTWSVAGAVGIQ